MSEGKNRKGKSEIYQRHTTLKLDINPRKKTHTILPFIHAYPRCAGSREKKKREGGKGGVRK